MRIGAIQRNRCGVWNLRAGLVQRLDGSVWTVLVTIILSCLFAASLRAQPDGEADSGELGDVLIQAYLARKAASIHDGFRQDIRSLQSWQQQRQRYRDEYLYMLGLSPLPEKTPLAAKITGTRSGDGFDVDLIHFQSRPGLYVTCNLYRPSTIKAGEHLPAVLYVCGHVSRGRNGNKTAFQSHGIWFARHGYVCLVVDTLQLGEIAGLHHGTYREQRWWWHSRGYTPAGVECWNGIRGIDYLLSRTDVDPNRIAVTGIGGGGAASFWIAAADQRVQVTVPVSGMADLLCYVPNRVINGHCDCMFMYNTFQWPWTRIAALVAPRPLQFANSDHDSIFPMDANERVISRLERLYSLYGASDQVDAIVSMGGHAYHKDLRQAGYRFINSHLRQDPRPIEDSEIDLVMGPEEDGNHPIPPAQLRVFSTDAEIPQDQLNTSIDAHFVPLARVETPNDNEFSQWRDRLLDELRHVSFRSVPNPVPTATLVKRESTGTLVLETEPGVQIRLRQVMGIQPSGPAGRVLLVVTNPNSVSLETTPWFAQVYRTGDEVFFCDARGIGETKWTRKNPPNYVERSFALLGTTVDTGRVRDVAAAARYLSDRTHKSLPIYVTGQRAAGVLAAYAALFEPEIAGVVLHDPPMTHMNTQAPQFLNVLRVCDIPQILGLLAPRPLTIYFSQQEKAETVESIYRAAGVADQVTVNVTKAVTNQVAQGGTDADGQSDDNEHGEPLTFEAAKSLKNPSSFTVASIQKGRIVYLRHCQACHSKDGRATESPDVEATDLTAPGLWFYGSSDGEIFRTISEGAGEDMPAYKDELTKEEIWQIVNFIRSIGPLESQPAVAP